jgi:hypothetical protein
MWRTTGGEGGATGAKFRVVWRFLEALPDLDLAGVLRRAMVSDMMSCEKGSVVRIDQV